MLKIRKTFKFRLYPTRQQKAILDGQLALCCELYNAALQERRDAWQICSKSVGFYDQSYQLPEIKLQRPDLTVVYAQVLVEVLRRTDRAFAAFFRRIAAGEKPGYPRFRSMKRYNSLTYPQLAFKRQARR